MSTYLHYGNICTTSEKIQPSFKIHSINAKTHTVAHTHNTPLGKKKKHLDEVNAKKKKNPTDGNKDKRQSPSSVSNMCTRNNDNIDGKDVIGLL